MGEARITVKKDVKGGKFFFAQILFGKRKWRESEWGGKEFLAGWLKNFQKQKKYKERIDKKYLVNPREMKFVIRKIKLSQKLNPNKVVSSESIRDSFWLQKLRKYLGSFGMCLAR